MPTEDLMTLDELFEILTASRLLSGGPPECAYIPGLDMLWRNLADELSQRNECGETGCSNPADVIEHYSSGRMGSESVPWPRCSEHVWGVGYTMVVWEDGGWNWLRRSH